MAATQSPAQVNSSAATGSPNPASRYTAPSSPLGHVPTPPGLTPKPNGANSQQVRRKRARAGTPWLTFTAFALTMVWFGCVGFYVIKAGGFTSFLESSGAAAIIAVTGLMLAPAALFWMVFAYLKRASDIESAIEPLLRQLSLVTGSGGVAETRVRRFNDALSEQLTLLKETGSTSTRTAQSALDLLTTERTQLEASQNTFASHINGLVATMRQQAGELETLVDSGQAQLGRVAASAREAGAAIAGETGAAEGRLSSLVDKITGKFAAIFTQLDSEQQEHLNNYAAISHDVSETLKEDSTEIEGRLSKLLSAMSDTLEEVERVAEDRLAAASEVAGEIASRERSLRDEAATAAVNAEESANAIVEATTQFRDLAQSSRSEAERLLTALTEQTSTLDSHAGDARIRLEAMRGLITGAIAELGGAATRMTGVGETVGLSVDSRIAALTDAATALDTTAGKITQQIDTQLENYGDTQDRVETLYSAVVERLRSESAALNHAAEKLGAEADNGASRLRGTFDEIAAKTSTQIETFGAAITATAAKLGAEADRSATRVQSAIDELARTTGQSLDSYGQIAAKAEAQATMVADNFNGAIDRYAGTARQLNVAAAELQQLAARCDETIAAMETTLTERAGMLEQVGDRMAGTSRTVKDDAAGLVVTLQQLTDRLETVRAAAISTSDETVQRLTDVASTAGRNLSSIDQLAIATLARLEAAGNEIASRQAQIGTQVDSIQEKLGVVSDDLSTRIGDVLSQVERSSQNAGELVETYLSQARDIAPVLEQTASAATEAALSASAAMSAETERFGDRLVVEKTRWQALVDEQGRAFADSLRDLDSQMTALRTINAELESGTQKAGTQLAAHTATAAELDNRLFTATESQRTQLTTLHGEIETIVEYLQRQAQALTSVTTQAVEGVRGATEQYGIEARTLGDLSRQTESQITAATERMLETRSVSNATREDVLALRAEIEQAIAQLHAQTQQLDGSRMTSREAAAELTAQTGQATLQLNTLIGGLGDALESATLARSSAFVQMDEVAGRVRGESEAIESMIGTLSGRMAQMLEALSQSSADSGRQIESRVEQSFSALREQLHTAGQAIADLSVGMTESAGNATVLLRSEVERQLAAVSAQADTVLTQIGDRAASSAAMVADAARTLETAGSTVTAQFERALHQIGATDAGLSQLATHAGTLRRELVDESESMVGALDRVAQQLTSQLGLLRSTSETGIDQAARDTEALRALLTEATSQLASGSRQLQDVSNTAGTYLAGLSAELQGNVTLVRETSSELSLLARDTGTAEGELTDKLASLMGQITRARGDLAALDLQLADQSGKLSAQQQDVLANLSQTLAAFEATGSRMIATGADALASADAVDARYRSVATVANDIVGTHAVQLEASVARSLASLSTLTDSLADGSRAQAEQLEERQQQLTGLYGALRAESAASADTLATLSDRITAAGMATGTSTQEILSRLSDVAQTLIADFGSVTGAATEASQTLRAESDSLQIAGAQIGLSARTAVKDTSEAFATLQAQGEQSQAAIAARLQETLGTLSSAQARYSGLNDQLAQQSADAGTMLSTVGGRFETLLESAQRTMLQLRQEMEGFTAATASALDQSGQQMDDQGRAFDAFSGRLASLVETIGSGAGQALDDLRSFTGGLEIARDRAAQIAADTQSRLFEATQQLESRREQFTADGDAFVARMATTGEDAFAILEARREQVAEASEAAAQRIVATAEQAFAALESQGDRFAASSNATVARIGSFGEEAFATLAARREQATAESTAAAQHIVETAEQAFAALESQRDRFTAGSEASVLRIAAAGNDAVGALEARREQLVGSAGEIASQIGQAGQDAAAVLEALNSQLVARTLDSYEQVVRAGDSAGQALLAQQETLQDSAGTLTARLAAAGTEAAATIRAQHADLLAGTESVLQHLMQSNEDAVTAIAGQSRTLLSGADQLAARLAQVAAEAANAERAAGSVTTQLDGAMQLATGATALFDSFGQRGQSLQDSVANDVSAMESALGRARAALETASGTLARHTQETQVALGEIERGVTGSAQTLQDATEHYRAEARQIAASAETTLADTSRILSGLDSFKAGLESRVAGLTEQLEGTTAQLGQHLAAYANLGETHESLRAQTDKSMQTLAAVARRVSETSSDAQSDLTNVVDRLHGLRGVTSGAIKGEIEELQQLIDSATGLINDLGRQLETQVSAVTDAGSALAHVSGSVNDNTAAALSRLQTLNQRLEAAKLSATLATEQAASRIAEILSQVTDDGEDGIQKAI